MSSSVHSGRTASWWNEDTAGLGIRFLMLSSFLAASADAWLNFYGCVALATMFTKFDEVVVNRIPVLSLKGA